MVSASGTRSTITVNCAVMPGFNRASAWSNAISKSKLRGNGQPSEKSMLAMVPILSLIHILSADVAALAQIFADDYVQYNEAGKAFTKQDVLNNFRTGAIRYPSIVSTGRKIRIFGDTAVVHGSESDEVEADGKRFSVRYVYLDVLRKKDGEWKLVASQLARPME